MNIPHRKWWPPIVWAVVVFIACALPGHTLPVITFWQWLRWDKVTHLFLFGILSFLLFRADVLPLTVKRTFGNWHWVWITCIYGGLLEYLQYSVFIGRSGDLRDAAANCLGAVIGRFCFNRLTQRSR